MKGTEYFMSLQTSVVITEEYNVMVNIKEFIGNTKYRTCYIKRCRYNRVPLYLNHVQNVNIYTAFKYF
jgi:hypothetical protein